jgi:cytochrome c
MKRIAIIAAIVVHASHASALEGNAARGERLFRSCSACHSLEPDKNMTGPSLSGLWGRRAGSLESFTRYSDALKSSSVHWNDQTLDAWLADPQVVISENTMTFPGIKDAQQRSDLLAFLKQATQSGAPQQNAPMGGMGGMMGNNAVPNLKSLAAKDRVETISYCRGTYEITTADG